MGDWFGKEMIKVTKLWDKIKGGMTKFQARSGAVD